ncbi:MAG: carboxymuconolactone decarboxylase family protein [Vitreoscilla sp.]|jgi:AhpD family alkylhydroperoxidase|nr:carboxymuconolactone decarboxylase family protein [Vitreoscilla sp.]
MKWSNKMSQRFDMETVAPVGYKAMIGLEMYLAKISLNHTQKELIKLRASQINGCAFCLDMHSKDALKYGETVQRIVLLNAWPEAEVFSAEEKALLAMVEEITLISEHGLSDETYQVAQQFFSETQIGEIIMATVVINAWNRIAISTNKALG